MRDGAQLPPTTYTRRTRVGGTDVADVADVERILDLAAHGATIVLQGLHRSWPPLAEFCLDLEQVLGHAVQANAYLTPAGVAGLASHADTHEVIVLHVAGTKRWDVDGLGDIELGPGDVLYMPAGTRHAAHTTRRFGLHVTLGVLATTYRDVIARHVAGLAEPDLDRPLPLGYASATGAHALAEGLTDALAGAAQALCTTDRLGAGDRRSGPPPPSRPATPARPSSCDARRRCRPRRHHRASPRRPVRGRGRRIVRAAARTGPSAAHAPAVRRGTGDADLGRRDAGGRPPGPRPRRPPPARAPPGTRRRALHGGGPHGTHRPNTGRLADDVPRRSLDGRDPGRSRHARVRRAGRHRRGQRRVHVRGVRGGLRRPAR